MGRGPLRLLDDGLTARLGSSREVEVEEVDLDPAILGEVPAAVALQRRVAALVASARTEARLPVVLSGNCNTAALGAAGGLESDRLAVLWLDAHGDLNTPATSASGFFDGMALAILTGRGWEGLRGSWRSLEPVADERIVLVGARDLDAGEAGLLERSAIHAVSRERQELVPELLASMKPGADRLYLHLDVDVLDPAVGEANAFATPGGLGIEEVATLIETAAEIVPLAAVGLTSWDPELDGDRLSPALADLLSVAVSAADRAQ